jgi:hypothetical protein
MSNKKNTRDASKNKDYRLREFRESIEKLSEEFPDMTDRLKGYSKELESVMSKLIARNATDEEIDTVKFDLMMKHMAGSVNLAKDLPPMLADARQRFSVVTLAVYAQVYYKIIEVVSSSPVAYADFLLNQFYVHVVKQIKDLLSLDELEDFTGEFDPPEHILPSSCIRDVGWEDGVRPPTEVFLAATQTFLNELDFSDEDAAAVAFFVKWLHKRSEPVFEAIEKYRLKTKKYFDGLMRNVKRQNEQNNVPYEIRLLEEIADKLESWAEERQTEGEAKIEEARVSWNSQHPSTMMGPLDTYFALPHLPDEFDFVVKTFQSENNSASATMLVEIQNDLRRCNMEIWQLTLQALEHFSSYDPESDEYESWLSSISTFSAVTIPNIVKRIRKIAEMTKKRMATAKPVKEPPVLAEEPPKPAETGKKDEPCDPLSWTYEMYDSLVWKEFLGSGQQWVGPFDPILRFHEDTESLVDILTVKDCITHLKKILPYWIEYQFVSPKSDILADMTHTIRCWLTKVRHDSNQKLPPIPSDLIGMADWVPDVEKVLAGGITRKETDYTAQEQISKHIKEPTETRQYPEGHGEFLAEVARSVHELVQNPSTKKWFQDQLSTFRTLRDDFAVALKEAQQAAIADPTLRYDYDDVRDKDKAPPDPPKEGYEVERHHVLDTPPKGFWRPKLPFNPDGWLSRFQCQWLGMVHPPAEEPRDKAQMLSCEYALLATIHDEFLDIPRCDRLTDSNQDDWVEVLWLRVCDEGATQDDIGMRPYRQKYIATALSDVKADLVEKGRKTDTTKRSTRTKVSREAKRSAERTALISALLAHHRFSDDKSLNLNPAKQSDLGKSLGWEQDKVCRALKRSFTQRFWKDYLRVCKTGSLRGFLKKLDDDSIGIEAVSYRPLHPTEREEKESRQYE